MFNFIFQILESVLFREIKALIWRALIKLWIIHVVLRNLLLFIIFLSRFFYAKLAWALEFGLKIIHLTNYLSNSFFSLQLLLLTCNLLIKDLIFKTLTFFHVSINLFHHNILILELFGKSFVLVVKNANLIPQHLVFDLKLKYLWFLPLQFLN